MLQWYGQLEPAQQAALQGLLVMAIWAVVRAIAAWTGKPISETAGAKFCNYLTVAVATAASTLLTTGATSSFWFQWAVALWAAVGSWEAISKTYKPIKAAVKAAAPSGLIPVLLLGMVLTVLVAGGSASAQVADLAPLTIMPAPMIQEPAPVAADTDWFDRHELRWCAMKSADTLESIGTGISLQLKEFAPGHSLWGDVCVQFAEDRDSAFGGLSTEAEGLPVPLLEALLKPVRKLTLGVFDRFGIGTDGRGLSFYGVTDF